MMNDLLRSGNATIVDVRTPVEFESGNVEGSLNIPMDQVPRRLEEFRTMSKPIILCCASGNRSGQVVSFLNRQGISDVHNAGGWTDVAEILNK